MSGETLRNREIIHHIQRMLYHVKNLLTLYLDMPKEGPELEGQLANLRKVKAAKSARLAGETSAAVRDNILGDIRLIEEDEAEIRRRMGDRS